MKQSLIQGKVCKFLEEHYISNKNIQGGILEKPVTLCIGEYILSFNSLYTFTASGMVCGGFLSEPTTIEVGKDRSKVIISSAFYYFDSEDIEFALLANKTRIRIGTGDYSFAAGEDIFFHPNAEVMSGMLAPSSIIEMHGHKIPTHSIGFWDTNWIFR